MKHRLQFAGKKTDRMLLLLLGVSLAAFLLMSASPLDPLQTNVGQAALGTMSQEQIAQLEDYWGVEHPPAGGAIWAGWLTPSTRPGHLPALPSAGADHHRGAAGELPGTAPVRLGSVRDLGAHPGGLAGAFRSRWPDRLIRGWCLLISSTPAFWLAILLLLVFSVWLGWFPPVCPSPSEWIAVSVTSWSVSTTPSSPPSPSGITGCPPSPSTPGRRWWT